MLTEQVAEQLVEELVKRIERVNTHTLKRIAEVLKEIGDVPPSRAYDLAMILKYGGDYDKIVKELAKATELNEKEIDEIFKKVAKQNQMFAKQFYDYRNIKYIPFEKNIELQAQVKAIAKITKDTYRNLSNSLGFARYKNNKLVFTPLAETYQNTIDEAVTAVIQGKDSYKTAVTKAIRELSASGIRTIDWASGYHRRLDSSVAMNVRGAMRDFSMTLNQQFGEEYGADGVEISVHDYPAPDHAEVQGHQFSLEEFNKFQNDQDCKDYKGNYFSADYNNHDRRSIGQLNCYHYTLSVVLGISNPQYTEEQLKQINETNEKGFELDGKHYTMYEGTQLQRKMELAIRKQQDRKEMASVLKDEDEYNLANQKITQLTNKYFELSKKSDLPTKVERLGFRRQPKKISNDNLEIPMSIEKNIRDSEITNRQKTLFATYVNDDNIKINYKIDKYMLYSPKDDCIYINTEYKSPEEYNYNDALSHELSHMLDHRLKINLNNQRFINNSILRAYDYIENNYNYYKKIFESEKIYSNMNISDIFSALTQNQIVGRYAHDNNYWLNPLKIKKELIADLFNIYFTEDETSLTIIKEIDGLKDIYERVIEEYGKIS